MKKELKSILRIAVVVIALGFGTQAYASDDFGGDNGFNDDVYDVEDPALFIDGLIGAGLVAGAAYAYKRMK